MKKSQAKHLIINIRKRKHKQHENYDYGKKTRQINLSFLFQ